MGYSDIQDSGCGDSKGIYTVSLRYEQYRALMMTREFLRDLLTVERYPKNKREMRERVSQCLRHYPYLYESGQPIWSQDDFTEDQG